MTRHKANNLTNARSDFVVIDTSRVVRVLLRGAPGWQAVKPGTFKLMDFEFEDDGGKVHGITAGGEHAGGFRFLVSETEDRSEYLVYGPLSVIAAVATMPEGSEVDATDRQPQAP
jgi:hypothetical protein